MAFDESRDEKLGEKIVVEEGNNRVTVGICRYDKGEPKIQIRRLYHTRNSDSWEPARLGRLTFEEFDGVVTAVNDLRKSMDGEG